MTNNTTNKHEQTLRTTRSSARLANRSTNKTTSESDETSNMESSNMESSQTSESDKSSDKSSETSSVSSKTSQSSKTSTTSSKTSGKATNSSKTSDKSTKASSKSTKTSSTTTNAPNNTPLNSTTPSTSTAPITTTPLSFWNNIAPRVYTPRALCFPFAPSARINPLTAASTLLWSFTLHLQRIATARPSFAGKLQLGINLSATDKLTLKKEGKYNPWHVYLQTSPDYKIPLSVQYPKGQLMRGMYGGLDEHFAAPPTQDGGSGTGKMEVEGWPAEFLDYENLKRNEFPVEPFVNPALTDLRTLEKGGEALPAVQVRVVLLRGGFVLNVLGHHSLFDGGAFTQFLNVLAEHSRCLSPGWEGVPGGMGHKLSLALPRREGEKEEEEKESFEELLEKCPEYKEWEDHEPNGPTHPVCDSLPGHEGESSIGSSKIFVFTFAKLVELQKEVAAHGVKAGIYECLSGLLWTLTYAARVKVSADTSSFERFLHEHFAEEQPVFSTPTDWIARVAGLKSTDPEVVAFKEQIAKDTKEYLGNKITWISTRLPSASLLVDAAAVKGQIDFAALAKIVSAINKSSTDLADNLPDFLTTRTNLFQALSPVTPKQGDDIRRLGLAFDPRQPSEWQMNSWKNFGADTEWRFPPIPDLLSGQESPNNMNPMVPTNAVHTSSRDDTFSLEVTKPDAVRRVQARYGVSGGLWLPARKEQKSEVFVQISLPEEAMGVLEGLVREGKWVERVI